MNVGVRFRQLRTGQISGSFSGAMVGFGLCNGNPYGTTSPGKFVGIRSKSDWAQGQGSWWITGAEIISYDSSVSEHNDSDDGLIRVSQSDEFASAWYARFTKGDGTITVDMFIPSLPASPTTNDFDKQLHRATFLPSVNNHSSYVTISDTVTIDPDFDTFNGFSSIRELSSGLRALEWLEIKAVRIA